MFYLDKHRCYRCAEFDGFEWLVHGFGTRHSQPPPHLATLKQIHSAIVADSEGRCGVLGQGDALVNNLPGTVVGVKTADCLPILLTDVGHRAVAAVHAGWRGTVAHIAAEAVRVMTQRFGTDPRSIHAALGPGIQCCCFEVGPEVAEQFGKSGRTHIDLAEANRRILIDAGVPEAQTYDSGLCTACNTSDFFSYRKEREQAGRLLSFIGVR